MFSIPISKDFTRAKSQLELQFIRDYLAEKGTSLENMKDLPGEMSNKLLIEASTYASEKLLEVQTRIQYLQSLSFEEW